MSKSQSLTESQTQSQSFLDPPSFPESQSRLPDPDPDSNPDPETATAKKGSRNARIIWTAEMTETLLETLKVQQDRGKRSSTGWKPEAWTVAKDAVIRASRKNANPTVAQVKSKVDNLKMLWKEWVKLGKTSGFGWSEEEELYKADKKVWKDYIKVTLLDTDC